MKIIKWIVLFLFDRYHAEIDKILKAERRTHFHFKPPKKPVNMIVGKSHVEKMVGSQEGKESGE
jgi:hypothetical protein